MKDDSKTCIDCKVTVERVYGITEFSDPICLGCLGERFERSSMLVRDIKDVDNVPAPLGYKLGLLVNSESKGEAMASYEFKKCGELQFDEDGKPTIDRVQ